VGVALYWKERPDTKNTLIQPSGQIGRYEHTARPTSLHAFMKAPLIDR